MASGTQLPASLLAPASRLSTLCAGWTVIATGAVRAAFSAVSSAALASKWANGSAYSASSSSR